MKSKKSKKDSKNTFEMSDKETAIQYSKIIIGIVFGLYVCTLLTIIALKI